MTDGNRPVRTRMPGGVGGAGSIPAPTRFGLWFFAGRVVDVCTQSIRTDRLERPTNCGLPDSHLSGDSVRNECDLTGTTEQRVYEIIISRVGGRLELLGFDNLKRFDEWIALVETRGEKLVGDGAQFSALGTSRVRNRFHKYF